MYGENKMMTWIITSLFTLVTGSYVFTFFVWRSTQSTYSKIKDGLSEIKISNKATEIMMQNINDKLNSISQTVIKDNK